MKILGMDSTKNQRRGREFRGRRVEVAVEIAWDRGAEGDHREVS